MTNKKAAYKVKANEFEFTLTKEDIDAVDLIKKSPVSFNILHNHRSVNAILVAADIASNKLTIEIEGENFVVEIKDQLDLMLEKMGFGLAVSKQIKEIKSPMPGLVLEIAVSVGQEVKEGDKILILQAMKMENNIVIHAGATIRRIAVSTGQAVEKGQVLIELE